MLYISTKQFDLTLNKVLTIVVNTKVKKLYFFVFRVWLSAAEWKIKFWLKRKISFVAAQYSLPHVQPCLPKTRPILKRVSALRSQYTSMGVDTQRNTETHRGKYWLQLSTGRSRGQCKWHSEEKCSFPEENRKSISIQMSTTSLKKL